jgi:hypothetical protein
MSENIPSELSKFINPDRSDNNDVFLSFPLPVGSDNVELRPYSRQPLLRNVLLQLVSPLSWTQ